MPKPVEGRKGVSTDDLSGNKKKPLWSDSTQAHFIPDQVSNNEVESTEQKP